MTTEVQIRQCANRAVKSKPILKLPHAEEPYYKFLACLGRELAPYVTFEFGVYQGTGLAHLALGLFTRAIGVDIDISTCDPIVAGMDNVRLIEMDSVEYLKTLGTKSILKPIVHLDTSHTPAQVEAELVEACRVFMYPVICIDDVAIDADMSRWWQRLQRVQEQEIIKIDLPELHVTGYGVVLLK